MKAREYRARKKAQAALFDENYTLGTYSINLAWEIGSIVLSKMS
jgi:hypothetical protein